MLCWRNLKWDDFMTDSAMKEEVVETADLIIQAADSNDKNRFLLLGRYMHSYMMRFLTLQEKVQFASACLIVVVRSGL